MRLSSCLIRASLLVVCMPVFAQPDYRCVIERVHGAAIDSDPVITQERTNYVGKEFTVDRRFGTMFGILKNSYFTKPQVIDPGSKDNSFKVVTTMRVDQGLGAGSAVYALVINEYVEPVKKPFVFLAGDVVYYGNCAHFR
jgi:hypothetical protein